MLKRYHARREEALNYLGGKCRHCGTTENLEIDHIDPDQKTLDVARLWSTSKEKYQKEIDKCQLLCRKCHTLKTIIENGQVPARGTHGTLSSFRYCKCAECREAKNAYTRAWKKAKRLKKAGS